MRSAAKWNRRKSQREATRERRQRDPEPATEDEDLEIAFPHVQPVMVLPESPSSSPPISPASPGELDYGVVLDMVQKINSRLGDMKLDTERATSAPQTSVLPGKDRIPFFMELKLLDRQRRHHTNPPDLDRPRRHHTNRSHRHHTSRWGIMVDVTCSLRDSLRHFPHAWRFPTRVHLCAEHLRRTDMATDRRHL